jgi:hypothetical protein
LKRFWWGKLRASGRSWISSQRPRGLQSLPIQWKQLH